MNRRKHGLTFENFCHFIAQVKTKKKALIYGPDYVVLSRPLYDALTRIPDPEIFFDEMIDEVSK